MEVENGGRFRKLSSSSSMQSPRSPSTNGEWKAVRRMRDRFLAKSPHMSDADLTSMLQSMLDTCPPPPEVISTSSKQDENDSKTLVMFADSKSNSKVPETFVDMAITANYHHLGNQATDSPYEAQFFEEPVARMHPQDQSAVAVPHQVAYGGRPSPGGPLPTSSSGTASWSQNFSQRLTSDHNTYHQDYQDVYNQNYHQANHSSYQYQQYNNGNHLQYYSQGKSRLQMGLRKYLDRKYVEFLFGNA